MARRREGCRICHYLLNILSKTESAVLLLVLWDSENSKIVICLDSFFKQNYNIWVVFRLISVFKTTALLNLPDLIGSLMRLI